MATEPLASGGRGDDGAGTPAAMTGADASPEGLDRGRRPPMPTSLWVVVALLVGLAVVAVVCGVIFIVSDLKDPYGGWAGIGVVLGVWALSAAALSGLVAALIGTGWAFVPWLLGVAGAVALFFEIVIYPDPTLALGWVITALFTFGTMAVLLTPAARAWRADLRKWHASRR